MIDILVGVVAVSLAVIVPFTGYFLWWLWKERRERKRILKRLEEE